MATVIVGGGIIGLSTAYYLSIQQPSRRVHIIDSSPSLLLSASGFAGGFLAKDWFSPEVAPLGELSFRLHHDLARENEGHKNWGYAPSTAYSLAVDRAGISRRKKKESKSENWLQSSRSRADVAILSDTDERAIYGDGSGAQHDEMLNEDGTPAWITKQDGGSLDVISSDNGCAQVEPKELCEWLWKECNSHGVVTHTGCRPLKLTKNEDQKVTGIVIKAEREEIVLNCSSLVITAGTWTPSVFETLFPESKTRIRISPLAGYSIVVRSPRYKQPIVDVAHRDESSSNGMCHSVFCAPGPDWSYAPEAISRMTKAGKPEIYVAGLNDGSLPLPSSAAEVKTLTDDSKLQDLRRTTVLLTGSSNEGDQLTEDDLEIVRQGLCFRPVSETGRPVIAKLSQAQIGENNLFDDGHGVLIAAGHGPWGISLSLGTGLVVAQILQGSKTSINMASFGLV